MAHAMGSKGPRVDINVTAEIIAFAERGNSSHCMTAMAIEQQCPWASRVAVDIQTIRFTDTRTNLRCVYLTPRIVQEKIVDFDDGLNVKPFPFRLQGAMVTEAGGRQDRSPEAAAREAEQKLSLDADRSRPGRRRRIIINPRDSKHRIAPTVSGGRTPPRSGARREFGLRAFRRKAK